MTQMGCPDIDPEDAEFALPQAEPLLIRSLRRFIIRRGLCPLTQRDFAEACGEDAGEVLATFQAFLCVLGHAARRPLRVGYPGHGGLTGDEKCLVSALAATQNDDQARLDAHLQWLARLEHRDGLLITIRALATALSSHGLRLNSPAPPVAMLSAVSLRLVS